MGISAAQVNELRKMTGAGLMDCKKALTEAEGNIDNAVDLLRKKGQKVSALRAGRAATEGVIVALVNDNKDFGVAIHLSSETDFVAKNDDFVALADKAAKLALEKRPDNLEALLNLELDGLKLSEKVIELVGKINEKIELSNYVTLSADAVVPYIHAGNKIGVLVGLNKSSEKAAAVGRDIAMQIAAMNPIALDQDGVEQSVIDREMALGKEKALAEGKPENILEKIAEGTVKKFLKENTLLNQQFVKDSSKTVAQVLKETEDGLKIVSFRRLALG
ncbi:MAG: translation elongation factor Ts [Chitinophagales bacterium]